jgi:hypothetical protein
MKIFLKEFKKILKVIKEFENDKLEYLLEK